MYAKFNMGLAHSYGSNKSPAEQLFSYGFLSPDNGAVRCTLPLSLLSDDPLALAKEVILTSAPTVEISMTPPPPESDSNTPPDFIWHSPTIWLLITNVEDGLRFQILQHNSGAEELVLYWCPLHPTDSDSDGILITDITTLSTHLLASPLWPVFHLRAVATIQDVVAEKLQILHDSEALVSTIENAGVLASREGPEGEVGHDVGGGRVREEVVALVREFRGREEALFRRGGEWLEERKVVLCGDEVVKRYLAAMAEGEEEEGEGGECAWEGGRWEGKEVEGEEEEEEDFS